MKAFRILVSVLLLTLTLPVMAQSPGFEAKYNLAKEQYHSGKYELAKSTIRKALANSPGISSGQRTKGQALIKDCDHAITILNELHPLRTSVEFPWTEHLDSISFTAGQPKLLTAVSEDPSVCKVDHISGTKVFVRSLSNPNKTSRHTRIVVKMGSKAKAQYVSITQAARPETRKYVELATVPSHASISIDGGNPGSSPMGTTMEAGTHRIHIEKNGFAMKDTTLVLQDDNVEENLRLTLKLRPNFATVSVDILPEEGFSFGDELPTLRINGQPVNLSGREVLSYDDDSFLHRYEVYQDGTIPVPFGDVDIFATATNFDVARHTCRLKEGDHESVTLTLRAIKGILKLVDVGSARDAVVVLDGKEVGTVDQISHYSLNVGEHNIQLIKEGFVGSEDNYVFNVKENEQTLVNVAMVPYAIYQFVSDPTDAKVTINGQFVGNTPTLPLIIRSNSVPEDGMVVEVTKDGYLSSRHLITPDFECRDTVVQTIGLTHVSKLNVETDAKNLYLVVKTRKGETSPDSTLVNRLLLPTDIYLPLRKKPYYVELHRGGTDAIAYRGSLKYDSEDKKGHHIQSWSQNNFQLLSANFFLPLNKASSSLGPHTVALGEAPQPTFQMMGNASLFKFRLFPGFSTSVLHGAVFMQENILAGQAVSPVYVPKADGGDVVTTSMPGFLPAATVLFLNDEIRVGGAIFDYMDVSLVGAYAWYPDFLKYVIPISHFTGHDVFAGVELSSRLPFIDVNLKAGMQMYFGAKANLYSADLNKTNASTADKFYTQQLKMPAMFVVSVGISLGGKDSKGDSIIRVF